MKYLTIAVPSYNSEDYLSRCLDSLIVGGEDVEILVINDGSTDGTAAIADQYAAAHPDIVKVIHKENGGHGSGVNKGLKLAQGIYYKVVDSDDWLDQTAYRQLLAKIKKFCQMPGGAVWPDLFVCNYIYNHLEEGTSQVMNYRNIFPEERICGWDETGRFRVSQYLIMHALIYRTEVLKASGVHLPEHTFYVDNIFANQPLPYVETLYYMDIDLYHYYLGRDDQSVNEAVLMRRIDQQIKVTQIVMQCADLDQIKKQSPKLAKYLRRNISIMLAISSIHLLLIQTGEAYQKRKKLWEDVRYYDRRLYYQLKYRTLSGFTYLPGKIGARLTVSGYRLARKIVQFQ